MSQPVSNRKLFGILGGIALGMFGFGFAMVPLYDVFCEVLGIRLEDGTGQIATNEVGEFEGQTDRWVTVQFDSSVDSKLPWAFAPDEPILKVRVGELTETTYLARNLADHAVIGHAVPSVAPSRASLYFAKTECFCFTQQQLASGEEQHMPVRFIIDPELPPTVNTLTLSYRFYRSDATAALLEPVTGEE
ncbi:MAG: cytochrome c oxidase assembly protein [Pseudomonadota bacterium]